MNAINRNESVLMKYLTKLNYSKNEDSIEYFNCIESYITRSQPRLSPDFISRFESPREVYERRRHEGTFGDNF